MSPMHSQFCCTRCQTIDLIEIAFDDEVFPTQPAKQLCTFCQTGRWHGLFERVKFDPERDMVANQPSGLGLG